MTTISAAGRAVTVDRHEVTYDDPFVSGSRDTVLAHVRELEGLASAFYGDDAGLGRDRSGGVDLRNPATALLVERFPAVADWLALVPSAAALDPLYTPTKQTFPNGAAIDPQTRTLLDNIADAHGIRSRAAVLARVLHDHAQASGRTQEWLSLACGAAQPVISALAGLRDAGEVVPRATLVDLDRGALTLAHEYASQRGVESQVETVRANVLTRSALGAGEDGTQFDVVDAVGLLEYLRPDDWSYTYRRVVTSRRLLAGAVTFLRNAFACVVDGGVLVVANMLDSHPQLGFTLDVVQWPHIVPRSVDEVLELVDAAGISGHVDVYLPSDGVYAVYVVRKS